MHGRAGRATGFLYGCNTLGAVAGTALAGFAAIPFLGLHATLLLAAAGNLVAALVALPLSPSVPPPPPPAATERGRRWLLALIFGMGAASLAYEVLWTRILVFYFGSSVYAYSLMLLLVLLGIAAGSLLVAPWADRIGSLFATLAGVELGLALWAPLQVLLFGRLNDLLVAAAGLLHPRGYGGVAVAQLLAALPLLLPPTLLMGISFPLAVRASTASASASAPTSVASTAGTPSARWSARSSRASCSFRCSALRTRCSRWRLPTPCSRCCSLAAGHGCVGSPPRCRQHCWWPRCTSRPIASSSPPACSATTRQATSSTSTRTRRPR